VRTDGQICLKTAGGGTWCKASPITDCACKAAEPPFRDPFLPVDPKSRLDEPADFLREVERALRTKGISLQGKGSAVLTTIQLMLLPEVSPRDAFVILGMEGMEPHQGAK
jgi:hypothetical protein